MSQNKSIDYFTISSKENETVLFIKIKVNKDELVLLPLYGGLRKDLIERKEVLESFFEIAIKRNENYFIHEFQLEKVEFTDDEVVEYLNKSVQDEVKVINEYLTANPQSNTLGTRKLSIDTLLEENQKENLILLKQLII